jgi:hypothetical protein
MQVIMVQYRQKLHSLHVHTRFFEMVQMGMFITFKMLLFKSLNNTCSITYKPSQIYVKFYIIEGLLLAVDN